MHPTRLSMLAWLAPGAALGVVGAATLLLALYPLPDPTFVECDPNVELERPLDCPPPIFPEVGWGHRLLDALASERVAAPLLGAGVVAGLAFAVAAMLRARSTRRTDPAARRAFRGAAVALGLLVAVPALLGLGLLVLAMLARGAMTG